jgi:hypothetical protein
MKSLEELKAMRFIPLRECAICGCQIGWYNNGEKAWFDPSCDCCSMGGGHYDDWKIVQERHNALHPTIVST